MLKKTTLTFLSFTVFISVMLVCPTIQGKEKDSLLPLPAIDRRVELLSIVFRLAGSSEYNQEEYKNYVNDIHQHFDKYKNHLLIAFAKELIDSNGIGYDAVMVMAVHIEQPPSLKPLIPFSDSVPEERWGAGNATKFVTLLQKFYVDARCEEFFKQEENTYKAAEEKFRVVYDKLDLKWYKQYYGKLPAGKFNIVIGLGNGGANYGVKIIFPDKKEQIYAIMGTWSVDSLGHPTYSVNDYLPTLIHEFNHSFINFLIEKNRKIFEEAGETIYKQVASKMKVQAYANWKTMICEALVRASVIEYLKSHDSAGGKEAAHETIEQLNNGFLWIKEQVALLDKYESNRQQYPTMESFIPKIAVFYDSVAKHIEAFEEDYTQHCPHVTSIEQFKNKDTNVDPAITVIKIKFDKALKSRGYSINYGEKGKESYPVIKTVKHTDDNTAIEIQVVLKPYTDYQFILTGISFKTPEGYPLAPYKVDFKTRK